MKRLIWEGIEHDALPLLVGPRIMAMESVLSRVLEIQRRLSISFSHSNQFGRFDSHCQHKKLNNPKLSLKIKEDFYGSRVASKR